MAQGQVKKIYELRTLGYDSVHKDLQSISKDFQEIAKAKKAAETGLASAKTTEQISEYRKQLQQLKVDEAELRKQRQQMINDAKAEQLATEASIRAQKRKIDSNNAEQGSIAALRKSISELRSQVVNTSATSGRLINFQGQLLGYDQAIAKLKELSFAEQDFRRQFARDGLLVAEYTSGIVNAFKQMGLEDLVAGQITKAQDQLKNLNKSFDELQKELLETQRMGKSTESIEQQMIENRNEVIKLDTALERLRTDLRGVADVGNQVTTSIKNGFKDLGKQIGTFALTFVSAQAAIGGIQKTFSDTVKLDSLESALSAVSQTTQEFAVNQQFLTQTTDKLGLELIQTSNAYKNFYAAATQAGLSADEARDIFTAAASASSTLKLSQEDTNGVLLAFGQIASKGKVQAEELRGQIGERIPGAFSIAARAIGVSQQSLNKMLEQGQVLSNEFLPKFAAELQKTFGGETTKRVEGLQASINRMKNQFTQLIRDNQAGLSNLFEVLIKGAGILIKMLPVLIVLFGLYTAELIRSYVATQLTTKGTILYNLVLYAQQAYLAAARIAMIAYYGAIALLTGGLTKATIVTRIFGNVIRAIPLGAILTLIGLIAGAVVVFAKSITTGTKALGDFARQQLAMESINKRASDIYSEQVSRIQGLVAVVKSAVTSFDTKKKALEELTTINKAYSDVLKDNIIDQKELARVTKETTDAIILQAKAKASAEIVAEKQAEVDKIALTRFRIESDFVSNNGRVTGLTDIEKDVFFDRLDEASLRKISGDLKIGGVNYDYKSVIAAIDAAQTKAITDLTDYKKIQQKIDGEVGKLLTNEKENAVTFEVDIAKLKADIEELDKVINSFRGSRADFDAKTKEREQKQKQLDELLGKKTGGTGPRGSRLTGEQKDGFKDIDATRDRLNAVDQRRRIQNEIDEETYLDAVYSTNVNAINRKLSLIKGANAEERKTIAELNLEKVNLEKELNDKLYELYEKRFRDELDIETRNAQEEANRIISDPNSTETLKAQAQLAADKRKLAAEILFSKQMDQLEKNRTNLSKKNAEDRARAIRETNQKLLEDNRKLLLAQIEDEKIAGEKLLAEFRVQINTRRNDILNSNKSPEKKRSLLEALGIVEEIGTLSRQIAEMEIELPKYKKALEDKAITEEQYLKFLAEYEKKKGDLVEVIEKNSNRPAVTDLGSLITRGIRSLLSFDTINKGESDKTIQKKIALQKLFAETTQQTFALAAQAMNSYFDQERANIERNLAIQEERLEAERQLQLDRAESQEEEDAINRRFAQQKEELNRAAFEKDKKRQKEQAKINLAMQLSNLAVVAFSPGPANVLTMGVAGAIMYGIQAAIALANYALNVSRINSATYEKGGFVPTETGGPIVGPSHAAGGVPFTHEAQGGELAIINKKSVGDNKVRTITGTNMQIASMINELGGGVRFANGAMLRKFDSGGYLGSSLQPPVYTPSSVFSSSPVDNRELINEVRELGDKLEKNTEATNKRIDRLVVVQKTSTVTAAQQKEVKQSSIGTL